MKFVAATGNAGKLREFRAILGAMGFEVISAEEAGFFDDVEETGTTFRENALIKARAVCVATGIAALADDSGLEVSALGGAPGVYSARYGGDQCKTDADRVILLLKNMAEKTDRAARFVSYIACVFPDGRELVADGECAGEIAREPRGYGGFGYDPVFFLPEFGKTMAEVSPETKNKISHRGVALENFSALLEKKG